MTSTEVRPELINSFSPILSGHREKPTWMLIKNRKTAEFFVEMLMKDPAKRGQSKIGKNPLLGSAVLAKDGEEDEKVKYAKRIEGETRRSQHRVFLAI